MGNSGNGTTAVIGAALIGAVAVIVAAVIQIQPWKAAGGSTDGGPVQSIPGGIGAASIFLSKDGGAAGSTVNVSGEGFAPGEKVEILFMTDLVATPTANSAGKFSSVAITVPMTYGDFVGQQLVVSARGKTSQASARAGFTISG